MQAIRVPSISRPNGTGVTGGDLEWRMSPAGSMVQTTVPLGPL